MKWDFVLDKATNVFFSFTKHNPNIRTNKSQMLDVLMTNLINIGITTKHMTIDILIPIKFMPLMDIKMKKWKKNSRSSI